MKYPQEIKDEIRKEATNIWLRIISGIENAIEQNEDVFYITDMIIMGDAMTYKMYRENWIENLEKARLYFERLEEFEQCKKCRDLKRKIAQTKIATLQEL